MGRNTARPRARSVFPRRRRYAPATTSPRRGSRARVWSRWHVHQRHGRADVWGGAFIPRLRWRACHDVVTGGWGAETAVGETEHLKGGIGAYEMTSARRA